MYIPNHYAGKDKNAAIAFMRQFNFGIIINTNNERPLATHLPFVITESDDKIILTSHFARANEHWQYLESSDSLVIFAEPHAYISPKHYNKKENVPTWNYLAVHAYGRARIIEDQQDVFDKLELMMLHFEEDYKQQWRELSVEYKTRMSKGIVAFEIIVAELQSKEKLSQNKKEQERKRVMDALSASSAESERMIADYMRLNEKNNQ